MPSECQTVLIQIRSNILVLPDSDQKICKGNLSADNKSQHLIWTELTLCLRMFSVDNLCKQFGPRSGPTKHWAWSRSSYPKCFTLMVFLKEIFKQAKGLTVFSTEFILASSWLTLKATDFVPIIVNCELCPLIVKLLCCQLYVRGYAEHSRYGCQLDVE